MSRTPSIERTRFSAFHKRANDAASWLSAQAGLCLDRDRWRNAATLKDYAAALSWRRIGLLGGVGLICLGSVIVMIWSLRQPQAYPPPFPPQDVLAARRKAIAAFEATPPPALAQANRSVR